MRGVEVCVAMLLVVFTVLTFPFWTTLPMVSQLTVYGVVPVFENNIIVPSDPSSMSPTHGYSLMVVALVFALLGVLSQSCSCATEEPEESLPKAAPPAQEVTKELEAV
jgi:hypothetical protein